MNRQTCLLLALLVPRALTAQHDGVGRPLVHYGKWAAAALAVTFTVLGAREHSKSDQVFGDLLALCRADNANCLLGSDGSYRDATAENLYQTSVAFDRRARTRLVAGQVSLLLCAGLFLADLSRHARGPGNVPFHGIQLWVDPRAGSARIGLRTALPGP